jgi:hypothetical protein
MRAFKARFFVNVVYLAITIGFLGSAGFTRENPTGQISNRSIENIATPVKTQRIDSFGTCVPNPYQKTTLPIKFAEDVGFRWVRLSAFWSEIESQPDQFDFSVLDHNVNLALERGMNIVLQIHPFFPPWMERNEAPRNCWGDFDCSNLPSDRKEFEKDLRDFVRQVVLRYRGNINHFKIWSEPDGDWFFRGSANEFVDHLFIPAAQEIRSVYPQAKVLGPGVVFSVDFLDTVLKRACSLIDIVTIHAYDGNTVESRMEKVNQFVDVIKRRCHKPIWVTEFGFRESEVGKEELGDKVINLFREMTNVSEISKAFHYRMATHYKSDIQHGLISIDVFRDTLKEKKPAFYEVKRFLQSQPGASDFDLTFEALFFNSKNTLRYQAADKDKPSVTIGINPNKRAYFRIKAFSRGRVEAAYHLSTMRAGRFVEAEDNSAYKFERGALKDVDSITVRVTQGEQRKFRKIILKKTK